MRGLLDFAGVGLAVFLGMKAWGLWQIQDGPSLEPQPILSQWLSTDSPRALGPLNSVSCERRAPMFWESAQRMRCTAEGPKVFGMALTLDTYIPLDPDEPAFDFEVRKGEKSDQLLVQAGVNKEAIFPGTALHLLKKRLAQVQEGFSDPNGKGQLAEAKAMAERRHAAKEAWAREP